MNQSLTRNRRRTTSLKSGGKPTVRRPVKKVYGAKSKYMPEGESVYERARALRKAAKT
jgi:hypothetical protein